ncbi:RNA 2',3'-cyclic phosphodiesterase [Gordoniibacillus kamchatkensis]|uniref:RNA 2',3'-cyclic phosphodiesterase n=1 Tax=Gordoniibacillus kamchatkensis TaxID=1590651 RepID=UPI000695AE28|nr:RNA 2',3'-cyclic phosphodiesterase [Paenibacillus sp. VKM B-2647]
MALRQAAEAAAPFELEIAGLGVFGAPARPTILWAGVGGGLAPLAACQRRVEDALAALGYEREARPFRPHVTLARKYSGVAPFPRAELERLAQQLQAGGALRWTARTVVLCRSHLGRTPMYEALAEFPLQS